MYHYVRNIQDSSFPEIKGLEFESFKRQLDFLNKKFSIISYKDLVLSLKGESNLPKNPCWLTFDDGYKDHYQFVFRELKSRGIEGSFFVPVFPILQNKVMDVNKIHFILANIQDKNKLLLHVDNLAFKAGITKEDLLEFKKKLMRPGRYDPQEVVYIKRMLQQALPINIRTSIIKQLFAKFVSNDEADFSCNLYLDVNELSEMINSGMYIGNHGYSHMWMDKLDKIEQEEEIIKSIQFLKNIGAPTVDWIMCYPYGGYNSNTLEIVRKFDCLAGVTTIPRIANLDKDSPYELPRLNTNDFPQ